MNKAIGTMKCRVAILEALDQHLSELEDNRKTEYAPTGKRFQRKDWKTGELKWLDEAKTIPDMAEEYGNVAKKELSEEDKLYLEEIKHIRDSLDRLLQS